VILYFIKFITWTNEYDGYRRRERKLTVMKKGNEIINFVSRQRKTNTKLK
jgi:hypothetical protein